MSRDIAGTQVIECSYSLLTVDDCSTGPKIKPLRQDNGMPDQGEQDAKTYERLRALGMPSAIEPEEFMRIMDMSSESKSTDAKRWVQFLSSHFMGRQEVRKAREKILRERWKQMQVPVRPVSHLKAPSSHVTKTDSIPDDPLRAAGVRNDMAYRNLESARTEYTREIEYHGSLGIQTQNLSQELEKKRHVAYMLRLLEKQGKARLERIGEERDDRKGLTELFNNLRSTSTAAINILHKELKEGIVSITRMHSHVMPSPAKRQWVRFKHTTEALGNLHALHLRQARRNENQNKKAELAGIDTGNETACQPIITKLEALLRHFGVNDKAEKEKITKKIVAVARRRARCKALMAVLDHGIITSQYDDMQLTAIHVDNEEMKLQTQTKMNQIVALIWTCEAYGDLISTFRSQTAPVLQSALCVESKRVEGYVDTLRETITQQSHRSSLPFVQEARSLVGSPQMAIANTIRDVLTLVTASEELVGIRSSCRVEGAWSEITMQTDRNKRLLERKAAKMEYGFEIADEVEKTLKNARRLK